MKLVHYKDPHSFNTTYFELINYDSNFIIEHSETSDNRPYTNLNFTSEPSPDEHNPHTLQMKLDRIFHILTKMKLQNYFKTKKLHTLTLFQTLLKQLQFKTHQSSLRNLRMIHKVLQ